MAKLIEAADVQRDANGYWYHPDLPPFGDGDGEKARAWLSEQRLEEQAVWLESDDASPAYHAYWEREEPPVTWEPAPPAGDGWFLLCLGETEDGPVATYVRRIP